MKVVGAPRFELGTSRSRSERATKLRYAPPQGSIVPYRLRHKPPPALNLPGRDTIRTGPCQTRYRFASRPIFTTYPSLKSKIIDNVE